MARRKRNRREDKGFNVWRSYSDMMAGVLLLFVLIMCVTLFQAQKNYVEKIAEQEQRIRLQDEYAAEMTKKQEELAEQDFLGQALGYTPAGMEDGFSFEALFPDYAIAGMPESFGYILSAIIGTALLVVAFKVAGSLIGGRTDYDATMQGH